MKIRWLRVLAIVMLIGAGREALAQSNAFGPNLGSQADVTVTSGAAAVVFTPVNQNTTGATACEIIQNTGGTNNARCDDSSVSSSRGFLLIGSAYGSYTVCAPGSVVWCIGVGGSTTIGVTPLTR